jgi:hypothetical protein
MASENNNNNSDKKDNIQPPGQDPAAQDRIDTGLSKELKEILKSVNKRYGNALRRLAGWDSL